MPPRALATKTGTACMRMRRRSVVRCMAIMVHCVSRLRRCSVLLVSGIFLAALSFCILFLLSATTPTTTAVRYHYDDGDERNGSLPLSVTTDGERLRVVLVLDVPPVASSVFIVYPDDCLDAITVNGTPFTAVQKPVCFSKSATVSLSHVLQKGTNTISFALRDFGGIGGLDFRVAPWDPLRITLLALLFSLPLFFVLFILRTFCARSSSYLLCFLLFAGLVLRLLLSPLSGYGFDTSVNQKWARSAAHFGLAASYQRQLDGNMLPDYPPVTIGIFSFITRFSQFTLRPRSDYHPPSLSLIKLPAILADLLTTVILFFLIKKRHGPGGGLLAATVALFHPAILYDSSVWGQTDSVYTLFILAALGAATGQWWTLAGALGATALLTKPQALVVFPVLLSLAARTKTSIVRWCGGAFVMIALIISPFALHGNVRDVTNVYFHAVGSYPTLTMGAHNMWTALFGRETGLRDTQPLLGPLNYRAVGLVLFSLSTLFLLAPWLPALWRKRTNEKNANLPLLLTALISYAFFLFNTEMHERYLFPYVVLGIPLLWMRWPGIALYSLASLAFLLNLLHVLPFTLADRWLSSTFPNLPSFIGSSHLFLFVLTTILVLRSIPFQATNRHSTARS